MTGPRRISKEAIVQCARGIIAEHGVSGLTFQRIAGALGVTKQAVIYWYPSKNELGRDLMFPLLAGEAEATIRALEGAGSAADAIERFLRALVEFHLGDLGGFRMMYLASQIDERAREAVVADQTLDEVHRVTGPMYAALAEKLARDPGYPRRTDARQQAVACHMAGVGLLTMIALGEALHDPMAHGAGALLDALVALMTRRRSIEMDGVS
jgi:AcrR family transcriptional regulator